MDWLNNARAKIENEVNKKKQQFVEKKQELDHKLKLGFMSLVLRGDLAYIEDQKKITEELEEGRKRTVSDFKDQTEEVQERTRRTKSGGIQQKEQMQCKICFERRIARVYQKCGHTVCEVCGTSLGKCPFCMAQSPTIKLFL